MADMADTTGSGGTAHPATRAAEGRWVLDPAASSVRFTCKAFWGLANVKGTFAQVGGEGDVRQGGTVQGTLTLGAASLDTGNGKRDKHLRSADFFDADQHPEVVFTAHSLTPAAADAVEVAGELTVRGTTRPLSFTAQVADATADAATITADVEVGRADFGMTWNQLGSVGDTAKVTVTARFVHQG